MNKIIFLVLGAWCLVLPAQLRGQAVPRPATQAQVNAGVNNGNFVTPKTLGLWSGAPTGVTSNTIYGVLSEINSTGPTTLANLYRWQNTLMQSNRPFRLYMTSDQDTGGGWPFAQADYFQQLFGIEGGLLQGGYAVGALTSSNTGVSQDGLDAQLFIGTSSNPYRFTNSASSMTIYRIASGASPETNALADSGHVIYLKTPLGGTFTIQTNLAGGGWATWRTVADVSAGTNLVSTNLTLPDGRYALRIVGATGTNRIYGGGLWHSTNRVVLPVATYLNSGPSITNWLPSVSTILPQWFAIMNPDLMLVQDTGPTNAYAVWPALEAMWATSAPNADVVIVGQFINRVDVPGTESDAHAWNQLMRNRAIQYGRGFFNTEQIIPSIAVADAWTNSGLLKTDLIHLDLGGGLVLNAKLWSDLTSVWPVYRFFTTNRTFYGTFNVVTPTGDSFTIGPDSLRFRSVSAGGGGMTVTNWNFGGAPGRSSLFLGANTFNPTLSGDGFVTVLRGTNGIYLYTLDRADGLNGNIGRFFASGGLNLWAASGGYGGTYLEDPGPGGLTLGGNLNVYGSNMTSFRVSAGATNYTISGATGWQNTNNSAAFQGVVINSGNVTNTGVIQSTNGIAPNTALTMNGAATTATGKVIDYSTNGLAKFTVNTLGSTVIGGTLLVGSDLTVPGVSSFLWSGRSRIYSPADSRVQFLNQAGTAGAQLEALNGIFTNGFTGNGFAITNGNIYVTNDVSALTFTDRSRAPDSLVEAYEVLDTLAAKDGHVDHEKLSPKAWGTIVREVDGVKTVEPDQTRRDLGYVVSVQAEIIKDLLKRVAKLEKP